MVAVGSYLCAIEVQNAMEIRFQIRPGMLNSSLEEKLNSKALPKLTQMQYPKRAQKKRHRKKKMTIYN